jgi:peptide/nickel transport system substrate-binding protein
MALVAACAACSSGPAATSAASAGPQQGGTVTWTGAIDTGSLIPWAPDHQQGLYYNNDIAESLAIYDALVSLSTTGQVEYNRIAQSLTSTDEQTWTMKLRPSVKFSDGTACDAAAVKSDWDYVRNNPTVVGPTGTGAIQPVASEDVVNPLTLRITLKAPMAFFPLYIASKSSLVFPWSPTAMTKEGPNAFATHPVGAGAFVLSSWVPNSQMTLTRNPHYYQPGLPHVSSVVVKYIPDSTQAYNTLVSGAADIDSTFDLTVGKTAQGAGYAVTSLTAGNFQLWFNLKKAPFDNLQARQALAYALDASALNQTAFEGLSESAATLFPSSSAYYDAGAKQLSFNAARAQALFNQLAAQGKEVNFTLMVPDLPPYTTIGQWIQTSLASFKNVKVSLDLLGSAVFGTSFVEGNFQGSIISGPIDPIQFSTVFSSNGSSNHSGYANPKVDQLIGTLDTAPSSSEQEGALAAAQAQVVQDVPVFYLVRQQDLVIYSKIHFNGPLPILSNGLIDFSRLALAAQK